MRVSRIAKAALSSAVALFAAGGGSPSHAAELAPSSAETSILRLDPSPIDAHVYVRHADSGRTMHVCTGPCTLKLASGAYRIDAGFRHRELIRASEAVILPPGEDRWLNVGVRENATRNYVGLGLFFTGAPAFLIGLPIALVQGGGDRVRPDSVGGALVIGGAVCTLAGMAVMAFFDPAVVELRRWSESAGGRR